MIGETILYHNWGLVGKTYRLMYARIPSTEGINATCSQLLLFTIIINA